MYDDVPSGACAHDQRITTHTNSDGSTRQVVYCVKCGMEW